MRVLLDTHMLLWFVRGDERLPRPVRARIEDPGTALILSDVSAWEIAIKVSIGKLDLGEHPRTWLARHTDEMGLTPLPISRVALLRTADLPFHHRDPFDRLLVAQALEEDLPLASVDRRLAPYGVRLL